MKQRVPRRSWQPAPPAGHRPRVLVEDDQPALAVSDFSLFEQAGFDVAFCTGPGDDRAACPALRAERCPVLAGADVVLHGLDPRLGVAGAIRRQCPATPVLLKRRAAADSGAEPVPGRVLLAPECSVRGQIEALRSALARKPN